MSLIERAKKIKEALEIYEKFKDNKLSLENYKNTYLNDKGFTLNDLKADSSLFIGNDYFGEFIGYPLYLNNEFVGIKRLYQDKKYTKGLTGFHRLGNLEKENLNICFIVEGYATGLSVHLALNKTVFIADNCHKLKDCVKEAISQVRAINPNCLIVICTDKDKNKIGEIKAREAYNEQLGVIFKLPYLSDSLEDKEKEKLDFDDLRTLESLDSIRKQLDPDKLIQDIGYQYFEYKGCYIEIPVNKESGKSILGLENIRYLTNFIIQKDYEFKEESGNTKRFIKIIGKKEISKLTYFESENLSSLQNFEKWVYSLGKFHIEKGFDLLKLRKLLDKENSLFVSDLKKIGLNNRTYYFGNCAISKDGLFKPLENGFFENGFDEKGNKLALSLSASGKLPILNLDVNKNDSLDLLKLLIESLQKAYGLNALMALGALFSGLFRSEIADITGTNQYPSLWAYGNPQSGKSSLLKLFRNLQGFQGEAVGANAKEAVLNTLLKERSSLILAITEAKGLKDLEKIELILQSLYDGQVKAKMTRAGNNHWAYKEASPEAFVMVDSNHSPRTESVLERLILIEFLKKDFKVKEATILNIHKSKLSSITRHFLEFILMTENGLNRVRELFKESFNKYSKVYESREALNACYIESGIILLLLFLSEKEEYEEFSKSLNIEITNYIESWLKSSKEARQEQGIANNFFDYLFNKFLIGKTDCYEKLDLRLRENKLYITSELINICLEDYVIAMKGYCHSKLDIKDSIKRSQFIESNKCHKINKINQKSYVIDISSQDLPESIKDFIEKDSQKDKRFKPLD